MKDLKEWLRTNAREVALVIGIIVYFIGAICFGKAVWNVDYETVVGQWMALIIGELVYLYIFTFLTLGVEIILFGGIGWPYELLMALLCFLIISMYLGVILKNTKFIACSIILVILIVTIIIVEVRKNK